MSLMEQITLGNWLTVVQIILMIGVIPLIKAIWSLDRSITALRIEMHRDFATNKDLEKGLETKANKRS